MLLGTEATTIRGFVFKLKVKKDFAILSAFGAQSLYRTGIERINIVLADAQKNYL